MNEFKYTPAIKKLRTLKKRIRKIPGGTSAGKTFGIIPLLIQEATTIPFSEISIVSESIPHLRKGALKDFIKIMKLTSRYIDKHWNRTLLVYTFANGSFIEFFSADQEEKVRGPRRNTLYLNECNNVSFETYHQLAIRTDRNIWLDYNPSAEFWIHTELADDEDSEELVLTYKDNTALAETIIKDIEKALYKAFHNPDLPFEELFKESNIKNSYWANWWKVYGLGKVGSLEGVIFKDWSIMQTVPPEARLVGYGLDFGYTNHPTAWVAIYQYNGAYIYDELIYQSGLKNHQIAALMNQIGAYSTTVADSAEPKSIDEIEEYAIDIVGVSKGTDGIRAGIQIMQDKHFYVTAQSTNLIKEFRSYQWLKSRTGETKNAPIDAFNHGIDAIRYWHLFNKFGEGNGDWETF